MNRNLLVRCGLEQVIFPELLPNLKVATDPVIYFSSAGSISVYGFLLWIPLYILEDRAI